MQEFYLKDHLNQDLLHAVMNLIHNKELLKMAIASKKLGRPNATNEIVNHILRY